MGHYVRDITMFNRIFHLLSYCCYTCDLNILGTHMETLVSFFETGVWQLVSELCWPSDASLARMDALKETYFHKTIYQNSCCIFWIFKKFYLHSSNSKVVDDRVCLSIHKTFWKDSNIRASTASSRPQTVTTKLGIYPQVLCLSLDIDCFDDWCLSWLWVPGVSCGLLRHLIHDCIF
jgi:hypothetical protein